MSTYNLVTLKDKKTQIIEANLSLKTALSKMKVINSNANNRYHWIRPN